MSERGQANWDDLLAAPQRVLERAARQLERSARWRAKLAQWGVVGVGYGRRMTGRRRVLHDELCIVLRVKRKWTRADERKATARQRIPRQLDFRLSIDGRTRLFTIPVDVDVYKVPRAQAGLRRGIAVPNPRNRTGARGHLVGAACALVRLPDLDDQLYLLSCLHVLGGACWYAADCPRDRLSAHIRKRNPDPRAIHRELQLSTNPVLRARFTQTFALDAALAPVADTTAAAARLASKAYWGSVPAGVVDTAGEIERAPVFFIRAPRRRLPLRARFARAYRNFEIDYGAAGTFKIAAVVELRTESAPTVSGDSGAAVDIAAGDGFKLAGLHIAGAGRDAYLIPSHALFSGTKAFRTKLELAMDGVG